MSIQTTNSYSELENSVNNYILQRSHVTTNNPTTFTISIDELLHDRHP